MCKTNRTYHGCTTESTSILGALPSLEVCVERSKPVFNQDILRDPFNGIIHDSGGTGDVFFAIIVGRNGHLRSRCETGHHIMQPRLKAVGFLVASKDAAVLLNVDKKY